MAATAAGAEAAATWRASLPSAATLRVPAAAMVASAAAAVLAASSRRGDLAASAPAVAVVTPAASLWVGRSAVTVASTPARNHGRRLAEAAAVPASAGR